jgi:hypothetical protein
MEFIFMDLFLFVLATSLIDGLSTTPQIIILLFLLTTEKPVVRSVFYIAGVSFFYLLAGFLAAMPATHLIDLFNKLNSMVESQPDRVYYLTQVIVGAGLIIGAVIYFFSKPKPMISDGRVSRLLKNLNGFTAFLIGSIVTIGGLPGSVVYFAALDRIVTSGVPFSTQTIVIILYNLVYILPLVLPLVIYVLLHKKVEELAARMHTGIVYWNKVLMLIVLLVFGSMMVADSAVFHFTSRPLFAHKLL